MSKVEVGKKVMKRCQYCRKETEQEVIGVTSSGGSWTQFRAKCLVCGNINTIWEPTA